jgi:hypothetical protein
VVAGRQDRVEDAGTTAVAAPPRNAPAAGAPELTSIASAVGNAAMGRFAASQAGPGLSRREARSPASSMSAATGSRCVARSSALSRALAAAVAERRTSDRRLLRRELTAAERARMAELEEEGARTDLTPAQLAALNAERNAIVEGRGMSPATAGQQGSNVAQLEQPAGRGDLTPQQVLEANKARNRAATQTSTQAPSASAPAPAVPAAPAVPSGPVETSVNVVYELMDVFDHVPAGAFLLGSGGSGGGSEALLAPTTRLPVGSDSGTTDLDWLWAGGAGAVGRTTTTVIDPFPGTPGFGQPNVFTRFAGRGLSPLNPELAPRVYEWGPAYNNAGIRTGELGELYRKLQKPGGVPALTAEEAALLEKVTRMHAVEGAVEGSPVISLSELEPDAALAKLPKVATERTYVVRVRIDPKDVIRVNEMLGKAGRTERLMTEAEVLVSRDLRGTVGSTARTRIVSIRANPSPGATFGGMRGTILRWGGRAMVVAGFALTSYDIATAKGPDKREQQGRAAGGFIGGVWGAAFVGGFCIGAGIATGGIVLGLCGLAGGALGMVGGVALGGALGSAAD